MKKKNMAIMMAGVTVATTVAPAFAAELQEDKNYKVNAKDSAKLVDEVRKALEVKFEKVESTTPSAVVTTDSSVYSIDVKQGNTTSSITKAIELENKIKALQDGESLDVVIVDKGHQTIDNKVVNYKFEKYETVADILADVQKANATGSTLVTETKPGNIVEVKLNADAKDVVTVKVGDDKVDFTKVIEENKKVVGFEKMPFDIENGPINTITVKKTDAVLTTMDSSKLFDGMRMTTEGKKLMAKLAEQDDAVIGDASIASGFGGKASFEITLTKDGKEVEVITIEGSNESVLRLHSVLTNDADIKGNVATIAGETRFETAIEVSKQTYTTAGTAQAVVLVGQDAIVDGLAAAPLAAQEKAPILLAKKEGVTPETEAEILRALGTDLASKTIYIVGGTNQISEEAQTNLAKLGAKVVRISGNDRFETSLEIANKITTYSTAFVVGGNAEADAMSIAAKAADTNGVAPIIVAGNEMSDKALALVEKAGVTGAVIVGGKNSVSTEVESQLKDTKKTVERVFGTDRQATNAAVIEKFYPNTTTEAFVAKDGYVGGNSQLIDALTAAPLAGSKQAPIVLATKDLSANQTETLELKLTGVNKLTQIGGGIVITVVEKLAKIFNV